MLRLRIWVRRAAIALFLLTGAPLLVAFAVLALLSADFLSLFWRKGTLARDQLPSRRAASVVIPNWNGRDLLAKYLPSVIEALAGNPQNEIIVVDNASTDGSAAFLKENFPQVRVLELKRNLGFGGGSNAGVRAARNGIVVLLNSDMRVDPGFVQPLLDGFYHPRVFAVSSQIFFTDPAKLREETGLTTGTWRRGWLEVSHVNDPKIEALYPTFYAGGGSSAYDRAKFLELGGFDPLYEPFYLEDADLSYTAWKRGWTVHYEPRSIVYHEHRGTIGKRFDDRYISKVLQKNFILFAWKNIHEWRGLASHFAHLYGRMWARLLAGETPRRTRPMAFLAACRQLADAAEARLRARQRAVISDCEGFRRPLGGYFADRFEERPPEAEKLNVLFLSPYPIRPPIHGGAVFMDEILTELCQLARVHLLCMLDSESDREPNEQLGRICASVELLVRPGGVAPPASLLLPYACRVFINADMAWRIHRLIFTRKIDVVQFEYTQLAIYHIPLRRIATFLFEHDVYFQSVGRSLRRERSAARLARTGLEYLRALHFEMKAIRRFDSVQVCTRENRRYLESFAGAKTLLAEGLRAGINLDRYRYVAGGREPDTLLFVGNFQHQPNQEALAFFWESIWPLVRNARPQARLAIAGAQSAPGYAATYCSDHSEFLGQVKDIREVLERYAVFVCPVLSGSGVRVKLLEAFASGMPVVSTPVGAEGLADANSQWIELASSAEEFAAKIVGLLADPARAREMAGKARCEVEKNWDIRVLTPRLESQYREILKAKQARAAIPSRSGLS